MMKLLQQSEKTGSCNPYWFSNGSSEFGRFTIIREAQTYLKDSRSETMATSACVNCVKYIYINHKVFAEIMSIQQKNLSDWIVIVSSPTTSLKSSQLSAEKFLLDGYWWTLGPKSFSSNQHKIGIGVDGIWMVSFPILHRTTGRFPWNGGQKSPSYSLPSSWAATWMLRWCHGILESRIRRLLVVPSSRALILIPRFHTTIFWSSGNYQVIKRSNIKKQKHQNTQSSSHFCVINLIPNS